MIVNGGKFYSTGALLAHLVPIVAVDEQGRAWYAIADRDAPGLTVIDDWSSFGQRTTFSGTDLIDNVRVPKTHLVPGYKGYDHPTADGAIFQIIQAAVDTGIARNAIDETIAFVRGKARAWIDSRPRPRLGGSLHDPGGRRSRSAAARRPGACLKGGPRGRPGGRESDARRSPRRRSRSPRPRC